MHINSIRKLNDRNVTLINEYNEFLKFLWTIRIKVVKWWIFSKYIRYLTLNSIQNILYGQE